MKRPSMHRRAPILPQNPLDALRHRFDPAAEHTVTTTNGPFLRRVVGSGRGRLGRISFAVVTLWLSALLIGGEHGWLRQRALSAEAGELHAEVERLEDQLRGLQQRGRSDGADPFAVEQLARETFGLARPGDVVYRFDERNVTGAEPAAVPQRLSAGPLDIAVSDR